MIDISSALPTILSRVKVLPINHFIELFTFKKDRSIKIIKISDDELLVCERGYDNEEFQIPSKKLKKTIKGLIKKEFPRSNKAHLHSGKHK